MKARKSTLTALLATAGIALALPLATQADDTTGPRGEGRGAMGYGGPQGERGSMCSPFGGDRGLRGLNLTEEQRDKIFKLRHDQEPALRDKLKDLRAAREDLEALTRAPTYDEAKIRAQTDKSAAVIAELARMNARTEYQIYQLLTPEQKKQLDERKDPRDDMGPHGPGMMHPGMGPGMRQG